LKILNAVDVIACEDTRNSLKLLNHYEIKKRLVAYHSYNEKNSSFGLVQLLEQGNAVAVISDCGTPCISDPGAVAVKACIEAGFPVVAVPGATALIPALVVSGMRTDTFHFFGFLSCKGGKRKHELEAMQNLDGTLVLYESTHRIFKLLADIADVFPERQVCVCKEISKINEKAYRGTDRGLARKKTAAPQTAVDEQLRHGRKQPRRTAGIVQESIRKVAGAFQKDPRKVLP
jgi:16S rRNA (cytidine1402-2'-O)-methyltransferase